jgi:hypothetical protein
MGDNLSTPSKLQCNLGVTLNRLDPEFIVGPNSPIDEREIGKCCILCGAHKIEGFGHQPKAALRVDNHNSVSFGEQGIGSLDIEFAGIRHNPVAPIGSDDPTPVNAEHLAKIRYEAGNGVGRGSGKILTPKEFSDLVDRDGPVRLQEQAKENGFRSLLQIDRYASSRNCGATQKAPSHRSRYDRLALAITGHHVKTDFTAYLDVIRQVDFGTDS